MFSDWVSMLDVDVNVGHGTTLMIVLTFLLLVIMYFCQWYTVLRLWKVSLSLFRKASTGTQSWSGRRSRRWRGSKGGGQLSKEGGAGDGEVAN